MAKLKLPTVLFSRSSTKLEVAKGLWAEELPNVLWAYRTTARTPTEETPFRLTYGSEAVIPVEIGLPTPRILHPNPELTEELFN